MDFVFEEIILKISTKSGLKDFRGGFPMNGVSELKLLSCFNFNRILRCQIGFDNSIFVESQSNTSMSKNVLQIYKYQNERITKK